ncbi:MAG: transposase [candidate division Zixibacteria bacterium]|nr:transposase [candidate division Zixibacteria bacterium]
MRLKHYDYDGRARFVTFATHKRIPILTNDLFCYRAAKAIDDARNKYRLRLLGYVIMPDHVHLVLVPPEEVTLGPIIGLIKRFSS